MKKWTLVLLTLVASHLGTCLTPAVFADTPQQENTANSSSLQVKPENLQIVDVNDLSSDLLQEIVQGKQPEIAIKFAAQTQLPVTFFLKGELVNVVESSEKAVTIEVKQTFYALAAQQELFISFDLIEWKPFVEFATGNASIILNIVEGAPSFSVGAEINPR